MSSKHLNLLLERPCQLVIDAYCLARGGADDGIRKERIRDWGSRLLGDNHGECCRKIQDIGSSVHMDYGLQWLGKAFQVMYVVCCTL